MVSEIRCPALLLFHAQRARLVSVGNFISGQKCDELAGLHPSAVSLYMHGRRPYLPSLVHIIGSTSAAATCEAVFGDELVEGNGALFGHESYGPFQACPFNAPGITVIRCKQHSKLTIISMWHVKRPRRRHTALGVSDGESDDSWSHESERLPSMTSRCLDCLD